jgi:predicted transcriptional regulator
MADVPEAKRSLIDLTAEIVAAYVGKNTVTQAELPKLIGEVHRALSGAVSNPAAREELTEIKPAVTVKKSLTADYLICLEDGKKFKSLKRHLRSHYNLSPEQYREKWGLPADYPMVAPNYAQARSSLAKRMGLGQRKGRR